MSPRPDCRPCTHGTQLRQATVGGVMLTEARYSAGAWLAPHTHDRASMVFLLDGGYRERLGRFDESMRPGMMYVREANLVHSNMFGTEGARCLFIDQVDAATGLPAGAIEPTRGFRRFEFDEVRTAGLRLAGERWDDDAASRMIVHGLIYELIGFTLRTPTPRHRAMPRWVADARDRLVAEMIDPPAIGTLATEAGVHPSHFIRTFRRHVGVRPGSFIHQVRVARACELMARGTTTLAEVAAATGFADQSHFGRIFRRVTGTTPARWRREKR